MVPTQGTWLGISDDIKQVQKDVTVSLNEGDVILLYTDGITEATNKLGKMYGQERLEQALDQYADLPISKIRDKIMEEVSAFQEEQLDDMTLVLIKKIVKA